MAIMVVGKLKKSGLMSAFSKAVGKKCGVLAAVGMAVMPHVSAESLLDVYQMALEQSPAYLAEVYQREASSETYRQARSLLLPQVSVSMTQTDTTQDIISSDNKVFGSGSTQFPTEETTLSLTQSIYSYSHWARYSQSKLELGRIDADFVVAQQDLLLQVADVYFAALSSHEDYRSVQAEVRSVKELFDLVTAKRADGLARETDLLDAKARYFQSLSRELEIRSELKDALQGLRQITGGLLPSSLRLLGADLTLASPDPQEPDEWLKIALEFNPELKAARKAVDVAMAEVKVQKGEHYPTLSLQYSNNDRMTEGTLFGGGSEVQTTDLTIQLNVPIYSGGATSSKTRQAFSLYSKAQQEQEEQLRIVRRDVFSTYDGIVSDIAKIEALRMSVESYGLAVEAKRLAYGSGLATSLAVLDAERDLFFSRTEYARARYGYIINTLRLKRATGLLSLEDLQWVDSLLVAEESKLVVMASSSVRYQSNYGH